MDKPRRRATRVIPRIIQCMTDFVRPDGPSVIAACKQIHAQFSTSEDLLQQSFAAITPNAGLNAIAQMDEGGAMHDAHLADTQARAGQSPW